MHDPLVVAFEIRRPWPKRTGLPAAGDPSVRWRIRLHHDHISACEDDPPHRAGAFPWWKPSSYSSFWRLAGRDYHWPSLITVWHREPRGHDALTICRKRTQRPDGTWTLSRGWRWHINHWKLQIPPLQELRRRLLTRCTWCGGRSRKGDAVNVSNGGGRRRQPWWRGEVGLCHVDCSSIQHAHQTCLCEAPITDQDGYGWCAACGKYRGYGRTEENSARMRELAAIPHGQRERRP